MGREKHCRASCHTIPETVLTVWLRLWERVSVLIKNICYGSNNPLRWPSHQAEKTGTKSSGSTEPAFGRPEQSTTASISPSPRRRRTKPDCGIGSPNSSLDTTERGATAQNPQTISL
jgi:hypothetical protein